MRELREETGLEVVVVGEPVAQRRAVFPFEGRVLDSDEVYYLIRVDRFELVTTGWTEVERRTIKEYRWWSHTDLATSDEVIFPEDLLSILGGKVE